ncbi:MAG: Dam family site-specific DNA-(adenine-N6)-methyltransferase [Alphaproteobacteria bacterium]|nr:Dam family site-specific DNA-(adenine-N6)-methyltransferase [Alphaproteobacteria bacterium]
MSRPLLKWAGGKSRLAELIDSAFEVPCRGTYLEPFIGSAAVYLHRRAAGSVEGDAVLGDANPKLVAMHEAVRDVVDDVLAELATLPDVEYRDVYYEVRDAFNAGPHHGPRHAARFLWLNRAGFNGLYRENRAGAFNVPVGRYKAVSVPDEAAFRRVSDLLQGTEFVSGSFEEVLRRAGRHDQVYCDPPYVPLTQSAAFTAYCKSPFGLREQRELALEAQRAAFRGAQVVLSNHDLPLVRDVLYPTSAGFRVVARPEVSRAISRDVQGRKPILEVIASIGPLRQVA